MKKTHKKSLKFHTIYTTILAIIFLVVMLLRPSAYLGLTMALVVLYVLGNGIIHKKTNELSSDIILEYVIVSLIVLVVVFGALI